MRNCHSLKLLSAAAIMISGPAAADVQVRYSPALSAKSTATIGSPIVTRTTEVLMSRYAPVETMQGGRATIPAGTRLESSFLSGVRFHACVSRSVGPCGLDIDGDHAFDKIAADSFDSVGTVLPHPVKYETQNSAGLGGNINEEVFIFLGTSSGTLRLSYREFVNGTARPAFTEELTLPLGKSFPQTVAVKDLKMTITGVDGLGLHYRLNP